MKTRAITSMISVPNTPEDTSTALLDDEVVGWMTPFHQYLTLSSHHSNVVSVKTFLGSLLLFHRLIEFFGLHNMFVSTHHFSVLGSHFPFSSVALPVLDPIPHDCTAATIISPNESARPIIAGTKARPTNSFIVKLSFSSPHIRLDHATNRKVKSGENIAYTQSFTARTRRMTTSARVNIPNIKNIIALTSPSCTIFIAI